MAKANADPLADPKLVSLDDVRVEARVVFEPTDVIEPLGSDRDNSQELLLAVPPEVDEAELSVSPHTSDIRPISPGIPVAIAPA